MDEKLKKRILNDYQSLNETLDILKNFDESSKLILYGSVNEKNLYSDLEIAFICDERLKGLLLDSDGGFPIGLRDKIDKNLEEINQKYKTNFDVPIYWETDMTRGNKEIINPFSILFDDNEFKDKVFFDIKNTGVLVYDVYSIN